MDHTEGTLWPCDHEGAADNEVYEATVRNVARSVTIDHPVEFHWDGHPLLVLVTPEWFRQANAALKIQRAAAEMMSRVIGREVPDVGDVADILDRDPDALRRYLDG